MKNFNTFIHSFVLLLCALGTSLSAADSVYKQVYQELSEHANRLPGSAGYKAAQQSIRSILTKQGFEVKSQDFFTAIPQTLNCEFIVDGKKIDGVFPVEPNFYATTTTGGKTLTGDVLYLKDGSLSQIDGQKIRGSIILLDINSHATTQLFNLGAQAIIYVDNGKASQWDMPKHGVQNPIHLPRAFITNEAAQLHGLLSNSQKTGSINIASKWTKVTASNLYVHLKADAPEQRENTLLLTATYDTFGFVPDYNPQLREAANVALLAQTICDLKKQQRGRDIVAVFIGSHYSAQEGARYIQWAANNAYKNGKPSTYFDDRLENYEKELAYYSGIIEFLQDPQFLVKTSDPRHRDTKKIYRKYLEKMRGDYNYQIRKVALAAKETASDALVEEEETLRAEKELWVDLIGDVMTAYEGKEPIIGPEREGLYNKVMTESVALYTQARQEIAALKDFNRSHKALSDIFGENRILIQFHFDFASDKAPWIHNFTGDQSSIYPVLKVGLGFFDTHIKKLIAIYQETNPNEKQAPLFEYLHSTVKPDSLCTPHKRAHPALTALMSSSFGYSLSTVGDGLHDDNMPRRKDYDLRGLLGSIPKYIQAISVNANITDAYTGDKFKPAEEFVFNMDDPESGRRSGVKASNFVKGGTDVEGPGSHALLTMSYANGLPNKQPGYTNHVIGLTDTLGYFMSPYVARERWQWNKSQFKAFNYDEFGSINLIGKSNLPAAKSLKMFHCFGGGMIVPIYPTNYEKFTATKFIKGKNNASYVAETLFLFEDSNSLGMFTDHEYDYKALNNAGIRILGSTETHPTGYGLGLNQHDMLAVDPLLQTSEDLVSLNESRLKNLRSKNIVLEDVETLHANAKDHLEHAQKKKEQLQHSEAMTHSLFSATLANHAYRPLVNTTNDMIKAVVILLLLSIPFAFSLERLFCGFTIIYKQVVGFVSFFAFTFLLLYFAHPAFSIASSPIVIFLAFVIIIMSGMVIYIIMSKFKLEILALQGLQSSSHGKGGKGNTALASVVIGISTMRNRPLKTFLTALTIILLTFTILVFASFGSKIGVKESYVGQNTSVERIELKRKAYLEMPQQLRESIGTASKEDYNIFHRGAYYPYPYDSKLVSRECVLYAPKQQNSIPLMAALALDPAEAQANPDIAGIYPDQAHNFEHPIYLDNTISDHLELAVGDTIKLNGFAFQFAGNFNRQHIKGIDYLDGMKLIPPDFVATKGEDKEMAATTGENLGNLLAQIDTSSFRWTPAENLALINAADVLSINGFYNATILYPKTEVELQEDAARLAEIFESPVYAKDKEGIQQQFYTESFDSSGMSEIIVPLLLGGLIIFSSLLGSIVDREREIFTFSALGLAPPNVAALFFAESAVYAVLGGLGGYIISQLVAVFLAYLSDVGIFEAPEMNFSSLSSTYTILLVMATVMLSTIFPAIKAGKSANPGVARKWTMPPADGNKLSFVFPFTVASHDLAGILRFIAEHFNNHKDASLGMFAAAEVDVAPIDDVNYQLTAAVSLAPFDLGIFQNFKLSSQKSDIDGILEIVVDLERVSGSPGSWIRSNRQFIDDLRNQFLIWRSLPPETVAYYTQANNEKEQADA